MKVEDFNTKTTPNWCPGCGDYGILNALKTALVELNIEKKNVVLVSGIGCASKIPQWVDINGFHTLHGRLLPVATGVKIANKDLTVIAAGGDGDSFGIGLSHFVHSCRRNIDLTMIVFDNSIYGLTTGQTSPTSAKGFVSKSTPFGSIENPVNPVSLAIASGASFVARGFAGDVKHLAGLIVEGVKHKGFSVIDVLQPCVTFNHVNTYDFYSKRVYKGFERTPDKIKAFEKSFEFGDKIPIGVLFEENRETLIDQMPQLKGEALSRRSLDVDLKNLFERFV
jgi:2-oxoglutarate ferredoxin oxidoreductase subunit beta